MRLQVNCSLDIAMGVAAEIETRKIQGRGAFLQSRVMSIEKARKETSNAYEIPKKIDEARIAVPRNNAMMDVPPQLSRKTEMGGVYGIAA